LQVEVVVPHPAEQPAHAARQVAELVARRRAGKAADDFAAPADRGGGRVPEPADPQRQQEREPEQHRGRGQAREQARGQQAPRGRARQAENLGGVALDDHERGGRPRVAHGRRRRQQAAAGQGIATRIIDAQGRALDVPPAELARAGGRGRVGLQPRAEDAAEQLFRPPGTRRRILPALRAAFGEHEPRPIRQVDALVGRAERIQRGLRGRVGTGQPAGRVAEGGRAHGAVRLEQAQAEAAVEQRGRDARLELPALAGGLPVAAHPRIPGGAAERGGYGARRFQRKLRHDRAARELQCPRGAAAGGEHEDVDKGAASSRQHEQPAERLGEARDLAPVLDEAVQRRQGRQRVRIDVHPAPAARTPALRVRGQPGRRRRERRAKQARGGGDGLLLAVAQRGLDLARVLAPRPGQQQRDRGHGQQLAGQLHEAAPSRQR
jgi:hypothetical protein